MLVQTRERVGFEAMMRAGEEGGVRVSSNEAVAADSLGRRCRLEKEGEFGLGAGVLCEWDVPGPTLKKTDLLRSDLQVYG